MKKSTRIDGAKYEQTYPSRMHHAIDDVGVVGSDGSGQQESKKGLGSRDSYVQRMSYV